MLFNSITFLVFISVFFFVYWFILKEKKDFQNVFILLMSYVFYGWWDWRFLLLIFASTCIDFMIGLSIERTSENSKRKLLLLTSVLVNICLLGYFKYFNFFIDNWVEFMQSIGIQSNYSSLNIILPVGISFYTFQTLSYTIDIYRRKISPTNNFINFAAFVSFFPQLVAGPIERASNLLPQFYEKRIFDSEKAFSGLYLIIWGLFKKIVIADTCATYVDAIFSSYESLNSATLILGSVYFAFQIYGDFSGYSDIAIGLARILGFDLMKNFNFPYFSRDIAEFWRKWHISLSTWFRDYLYIPLGGSRGDLKIKIRNVFIIFIVSGFWHGANWTFLFWGFLNALYFLPLLIQKRNRKNLDTILLSLDRNSFINVSKIIFTFSITCLAWIFFRSKTITDAFYYIERISINQNYRIEYLSIERYSVEALLILIGFILVEWKIRFIEHPFIGKYVNLKLLCVLLLMITLGVYSNHMDFIYFQF